MIVTCGAVFTTGDDTVKVIVAEPARFPVSVADAVMVCVPGERADVENLPPLPILPSRFDTQDRLFEMLPSSLSTALPLNVMESY